MTKVSFNYADRKLALKHKRFIRNHIEQIFIIEGKALEKVAYIFCSDEYLLTINKKFLKHDSYTDILTFDTSEIKNNLKGEIYISTDRVIENAGKYGVKVSDEFLRVIFHGALHLCGYGDKTKTQKILMRKKEDFYIDMFHVKQENQA